MITLTGQIFEKKQGEFSTEDGIKKWYQLITVDKKLANRDLISVSVPEDVFIAYEEDELINFEVEGKSQKVRSGQEYVKGDKYKFVSDHDVEEEEEE